MSGGSIEGSINLVIVVYFFVVGLFFVVVVFRMNLIIITRMIFLPCFCYWYCFCSWLTFWSLEVFIIFTWLQTWWNSQNSLINILANYHTVWTKNLRYLFMLKSCLLAFSTIVFFIDWAFLYSWWIFFSLIWFQSFCKKFHLYLSRIRSRVNICDHLGQWYLVPIWLFFWDLFRTHLRVLVMIISSWLVFWGGWEWGTWRMILNLEGIWIVFSLFIKRLFLIWLRENINSLPLLWLVICTFCRWLMRQDRVYIVTFVLIYG